MRLIGYGMAALALLAVSACNPRVESRGNLLDPVIVQKIEPGKHNRAEVSRMLGTPSSKAAFDENTWYYISERAERVAFFDPKIVEQKVLMVKFDSDGVVTEVRKFNGEESRKVELVERTTPTRGKELGLLGQMYKTLLQGPGGILGDPNEANEGFQR